MSLYKTHFENLSKAVGALPDTRIRFMFFLAGDLSIPNANPKVMTKLKRFDVDGTNCYLANAFSTNYWNYWYIYKETVLKYITWPLVPYKKTSFFQTRITNAGTTGDTNHGDHVDFSIKRARNRFETRIDTHLTQYTDDGFFNFSRSAPEFSFELDPSYFASFTKFIADTPYMSRSGALPTLRINHVFNDIGACKIVYSLCEAALNPSVGLVCHKYKGKNYKVQQGKLGGRYIETESKKVYFQKGGNIHDKVDFLSKPFAEFIKDTLLARVAALKPDLETVQVILDENNELSANGNRHILFIYDFVENYRHIFYVKTDVALSAFHVQEKTTSNQSDQLTKKELACHEEYFSMVNSLDAMMPQSPMEVF
jgi:hypothetical protein